MPPDSVDVNQVRVDFEVDPIEGKGLNQAEHAFAEEGVDAEGGVGLVQDCEDGVAKN